jgi:Winged helix DNA-binding domain
VDTGRGPGPAGGPRGALARPEPGQDLGDKLRHSWGSLLKPAASQGLLCFGPSDGQLVRFTRPDQWLPSWRGGVDPEAALRETARRYLRACGAVTREDYARWWGVPAPEGGRVLKRLGDEVLPVEVGGAGGWMLAADAEEIAEASAVPSVRLLPAFDQYVVAATRHAEQLMPGPFKDRVYRPQGWLSPVLLAGGRMLGTWRQEPKGRRLMVTIEPFARLPATVRRGAEHEAERLATWTGADLELAWAGTPD